MGDSRILALAFTLHLERFERIHFRDDDGALLRDAERPSPDLRPPAAYAIQRSDHVLDLDDSDLPFRPTRRVPHELPDHLRRRIDVMTVEHSTHSASRSSVHREGISDWASPSARTNS